MLKNRTKGARLVTTLATILGANTILAGEQAFEVVSIREVPRNAPQIISEPGTSSILPGGRYVNPRTTIDSMILLAFDIPNFTQLAGLPDWARHQVFSVIAKPPEGFPLLSPRENRETVRAMVREMLASRFQLKLHTETRQGRAFKLQVARGSLKIKPVDPPVPPETEGFVGVAAGDSGGRLIGKKTTMARMASALVPILKQPVLDETGLKDYYTFDVKWSGPEALDKQSPGLGIEGVNALMNALEDLFGLRLRSEIVPLKYWVVDHVEHPTPN